MYVKYERGFIADQHGVAGVQKNRGNSVIYGCRDTPYTQN